MGTGHAQVLCERAEALAAYAEADNAALASINALPVWDGEGGDQPALEAAVAARWIELDLGGVESPLLELRVRRSHCAARIAEYAEEQALPEGPSIDPSKVEAAKERLRAEQEKKGELNRRRREDLERSWRHLVAEAGCESTEEWHAAEEHLLVLLEKSVKDLKRLEEREMDKSRTRAASTAAAAAAAVEEEGVSLASPGSGD